MSDEDLQASQGLPESAPAPESEPVAQPDTEAPATGAEQTAEPEPTAEPDKTEEKKDPWFMKRIHQQSAKIADLARQADYLAREKAQLEARLNGQQQPDGRQPPPMSPHDIERLVDLRAQERTKVQTFNQTADATYDAGVKEYPDFPQAVDTLRALGAMNPNLVQVVLDATKGDAHKALYQLGKNPELAERVFSLPPIQMAVELSKIAANAPGRQPPPLSKAPDPISPVAGSGRVETNPDKMSMAEWVKWREKQLSS